MKKYFYILLTCSFTFSLNLYSQWVWQNPLPQGNDLHGIKMFNSGTGFAYSYYNIIKTTNSGLNWHIASNFDGNISTAFFVNEQTAYLIDLDYDYSSTTLYKSTNGGVNWQGIHYFSSMVTTEMFWANSMTGYSRQHFPYSSARTVIQRSTDGGYSWAEVFNDSVSIFAMHFPSQTTGYIGGKKDNFSIYAGKLLKTTNAGTTWDSIPIRGIREIRSIFFLDNLTGYVSGLKSHLYGPSVIRTTTGGASWDSVYYTSSTLAFSNMQFVNYNTGYSAGMFKTTNAGVNWTLMDIYSQTGISVTFFSPFNTNNLIITGNNGRLASSENGGMNWTQRSTGHSFISYGIKFFDYNTGFATGETFSASGRGIVVRTTNSGLTWDSTIVDTLKAGRIYTLDNNNVFICGYGKIFKTTDKGASFTVHKTARYTRWDDICFPDENTGYVINKYKVIDKTTNGGVNWFNIMPMNGSEYFTICFVDANTGFFGGSRIFKTTNGGTSWDTVNVNVKEFMFCELIRYNNGILYMIGNKSNPGTGFLFKSTDLGASWALIDSVSNDRFFDITFASPEIIYTSGYSKIYRFEKGSGYATLNPYADGGLSTKYTFLLNFINRDTGFICTGSGGILKTTNGGGTPIGININSHQIPSSYNLYQNYPNPFNPSTIIQFSIPKSSQVTIKVYDMLGRLVAEILNEPRAPGSYSLAFDGSPYASGVYFYTIETPDFMMSKKMVLLK